VRRVNYYEDYEFMRRFEPHPDYAQLQAKDLCVVGQVLLPYFELLSLEEKKVWVKEWLVSASQTVSAGEPVATVAFSNGSTLGHIRAPRAGIVVSVPGKDAQDCIPAGPLFSVRYYENGIPEVDPFQDFVSVLKALDQKLKTDFEAKSSVVDRCIWFVLAFVVLAFTNKSLRSLAIIGALISLSVLSYFFYQGLMIKAAIRRRERIFNSSPKSPSGP